MKLKIDQELCIGEGLCEELCPEVFKLKDDGKAYIINDSLTLLENVKDKLEAAVEDCPCEAITF